MTKAETEALQILFNNYVVSDRRLRDALANEDDSAAIVKALDDRQVSQHALAEMGINMDYEFAKISKRGRQKAWDAKHIAESYSL